MAIDILRRLLTLVVFCLIQALVLNQIHLFDCATPLLYVYFVIMFPRNYPKWGVLLWSFAMGLCIDMFSNTPGMASASLTLIGALQPYLLELFLPRDAEENIKSSATTLGWPKFSTFTIILVFIYCLVFFSIEALSFFNWLLWLESVVGSAVLTIALILTLDSLRKK
jgi:rod shape-determining protein MreD